jgi:hypothetical protein
MRRAVSSIVEVVMACFTGLVLCTGCATQIGIAASPSDLFVEVGDTVTVNVVALMSFGTPTAVTAGNITATDETVANSGRARTTSEVHGRSRRRT